jgi:hypothetical protein
MATRDVTDPTANTDKDIPTIADRIPYIDAATNPDSLKETTLDNFLKFINGLTEDTDPDITADFFASYDASASAVKKVKHSNAGRIIQVVSLETGAAATGTTIINYDDTIPQQSAEGTKFMELAITPTDANNKLHIEVVFYGAASAVVDLIVALFQDATENALAVTVATVAGVAYSHTVTLRHIMTAGTTSATTFKVHAGGGGASTITFNGFGGNRKFGGVASSSIRITEVKV